MSAISDKLVRCVQVIPFIIHFPDDISLVSMFMVSYTLGKMVFHTILCQIRVLTHTIADVVAPIEREIRSLANGLVAVKDEQEYIVVRERTHRDTAESTNTRVKWWSILQAIVLFVVVAWQVIYLKVRITHSFPWSISDCLSSHSSK